jgi:hypothetical protein
MSTDGQNDLPPDNDNHTPPPAEEEPKKEETPEPVKHVSPEAFDSLKATVDGLVQRISELPNPAETHRDNAPGGTPWLSRGGRRSE